MLCTDTQSPLKNFKDAMIFIMKSLVTDGLAVALMPFDWKIRPFVVLLFVNNVDDAI